MSWKRLTLLMLLGAMATVYLLFDPSRVGWFPRCPFRMLTGYMCPGCGSQRAFHNLLNGDIIAAWHCNPAVIIAIPILIILLIAEVQHTRTTKFYQRLHHPIVIISIFFTIIIWWIGRNLT